jgi:hypothetical protein
MLPWSIKSFTIQKYYHIRAEIRNWRRQDID